MAKFFYEGTVSFAARRQGNVIKVINEARWSEGIEITPIVFTEDTLSFNGITPRSGDTFWLHSGGLFTYCDTGDNPYGILVAALLLLFVQTDYIWVGSDAVWEAPIWQRGCDLYMRTFPATTKPTLEEKKH